MVISYSNNYVVFCSPAMEPPNVLAKQGQLQESRKRGGGGGGGGRGTVYNFKSLQLCLGACPPEFLWHFCARR